MLGGYDRDALHVRARRATAPDGTKVPISLVYQKTLKSRRQQPALSDRLRLLRLLEHVDFSSNRFSLLDRGVVYALAHIRGGGELGKNWHDQGRMLNKKNTFTDFIAVAEHLVAQKYASKDRLVIEGGSAGGLLMGAVINMRPDLFKAVDRAGAVRGRHQHDARRDAAADRRRVRGVGQPEGERDEYDYMKSLQPLHQPRGEGLSGDAGEDVASTTAR